MRHRLRFLPLLLACCTGSTLLAAAPPDAAATPVKVKAKGDSTVIHDKSKPVRAALEEQYAKTVAAYLDDEPEAVLALRTPDFSAQLPSGQSWSPQDLAAYIRASFEQVERNPSSLLRHPGDHRTERHCDRHDSSAVDAVATEGGPVADSRHQSHPARVVGAHRGRLASLLRRRRPPRDLEGGRQAHRPQQTL